MSDTRMDALRHSHDGRVVTFYSFKGGTGRTMTLANVAWILAANGYQVLVADWDLESPGLHRFFHPFLGDMTVRDAPGIIDLIRDYLRVSARATGRERLDELIPKHARVQPYALSLDWEFPDGGGLDFLSPGRQNRDYAATLVTLDWDNFYEQLNGGEFLDAVRSDMKRHYDYVLIDSRTGLSDIADICTVQFPDVVVDCFTFSTQGIEGAAQVAKQIRNRQDRDIRILPVPMRVDGAEKEKVDAGRKVALRLFDGIPADISDEERREYWAAVEVPYQAYYAFEETLAVFGEPPGAPGSLLSSFERITARITKGEVTALPPMDEQLRNRTMQQFTRRPPREIDEVVIEFGGEDQVWAEWIAGILQGTDIAVRERHLGSPGTGHEGADAASRTLTVISQTYIARHRSPDSPPRRRDLAVYVTAIRPLPEFSSGQAAFLAGVSEKEAVDRLLRLLGTAAKPTADREQFSYYPGREPKILRVLARNTRFTGREGDLRDLREQLRDYGKAVVLPVTLQGLGGVGKTQVALEYVHRFKTDYDLVWWLDCSQPQFIDASLTDLGVQVQEELGIKIPTSVDVEEAFRWVLRLLEDGREVPRWLLVYDNAEDIDEIKPYLPAGGGHILITSRNRAWSEQARPLPIEVFTREESVAHLRQRAPSITAAEADEVAEVLGDLPLAVALAGAWLSETGYAVSGYLQELRQQAPVALSMSRLAEYEAPLSRAWDLSLDRLQERSPAAARLFQLCAVMEARIAVDLLYSPAMARVLEPFDPALSEKMIIGRVVQEINRLALIKLDATAGRVHVHRLVQAVMQERMSEEQISSARRDIHEVLASARPRRDVDDPDTWPRFRIIWPHLEPSEAMTSDQESVRQLFVDRVRYLWQRHDLDRGCELGAEVEQVWETMLAGTPPGTPAHAALLRQLLHLRFNLANILRDQARFEEAKTLDEAVLAQQTELLGAEHPHTLMTAGSLAADLRALGRYHESLKMDEATHPAWTELFGDDHPRTLSAANNLADSYRVTGDFAQALRVDEDTFARRRATLGALHPRTLGSASNVARDLLEAGRYGAAADIMESVRHSCIESAGRQGSVAELNAQVLLGIALRSCGRPKDAEPHFRDALDGLSRRFGPFSSEVLSCHLSHGANLLSLRQPDAAEQEIREALSSYEERLGPSHPHTLVALVDLADGLRMNGQHAEALRVARSAAAGLTEVLGEDHPYTLAARLSIGVLLADLGELEEAETVEAEAVERLERSLGEGHPDVLRGRINLLLTRMERGVPEAEADRNELIKQLAELIGRDHPDIELLGQERRLMRTLDPQPF